MITTVKTENIRPPYFVVGPSFWNDLPVDLRFEHNLTCFKSSLKTHRFTLFTKTQILMFIDM